MANPVAGRDPATMQLPPCDRCTQGVMDTRNDHWRRLCPCECHSRQPELAATPTAVLDARVEEWVRNG